MRKTFLTFCTAVLALLAVSSCGKIWDEFDAVHGEIDALKERIETLEKDLNDKIATINTKIGALESAQQALTQKDAELAAEITSLTAELDAIDGNIDGKISAAKDEVLAKITELTGTLNSKYEELKGQDAEILAALVSVGITKVEKAENGNVVLTFTDGSTVELGQYDANANNTGVVTVVEEDGVKYWAVVLEDGSVESLGVKVGAADLQFQVNPETKVLSYSVDGGEWVSTGVVIPEEKECLFTDLYIGEEFDEESWETVVDDFFTLVFNGEEYYLPIYKVDNSVVAIKAGKTFFDYGESMTFELIVTDMANCYVMTKPDGWRAKLDGKKLTVTAPSEANVNSGVAEADGEVLVHGNTADGKCKIAKLAVSTTSGFQLTVSEDGTVTLVNPYVMTMTNMWGETSTDFRDGYIGLATIADFEADPAAYVTKIGNYEYYGPDMYYMISNWKSNTAEYDPETWEPIYVVGGLYQPGVYEVDVITRTVPEIYADWTWGDELPRGSQYVVWAAPVDEDGMPVVDDLVYGYYTPIDIEASEPVVSFNDVTVNIALYGADSYIVGKVQKESTFNWNTESYDLAYYVESYMEGLAYGYNSLGMVVSESGEAEYKLSEIVSEMEEAASLAPDTEYFLFVIPVKNGKEWNEYTYADDVAPYVYEFKTAPLTAGGTGSVAFSNENIAYTRFDVTLTASEGTATMYYNYYDPSEYDELEDVAADLIKNGYVAVGVSATAVQNQGVTPGTSYVLAAIAVDSEGNYGSVAEKLYTAPEIVWSETFTATVGTPEFTANGSNWKVNMPITVEGGTAAKYYYYWNQNARTEEQLSQLPLGSEAYWYYYSSTTVPQLAFSQYYSSYQFAVVVESTDGELSKPVIVTVNKPESAE